MGNTPTVPQGRVESEVKSEGSRKLETLKHHPALKALLVLLPAIASSIAAYTSAGEASRERAAEVKDKAESGYQFTKQVLAEQQAFNEQITEELQRLKAKLTDVERRLRQKKPARTAAAVPPPSPPPPTPSTPLPPDLDKALQQQQAQQQLQQQPPQAKPGP